MGHTQIRDITGQKFGRLTAIRRLGWDKKGTRWLCKCDCGKTSTPFTYSLTGGDTLSCGCLRHEATKRGEHIPFPICGKQTWIPRNRKKMNSRFCSMKCKGVWQSSEIRGERSPTWKRGYWKHQGYVTTANGREHRRIMEDHIGRKLFASEQVHHKNGDKSDNRIENLQIVTASEHTKIHILESLESKECLQCGEIFTGIPCQKYCSRSCGDKFRRGRSL